MNRSAHRRNCILGIFTAVLFVPLMAQSSDHNTLQIRLAYATQLAMADNRDDARNLLKKITVEYPDSPEAYNNLAVLSAYSEDWKGAISLLKQAMATSESLQTSYRNLNLIYRYQAALAYRAALPEENESALRLPDLTMLTSPSHSEASTAEAKAGAESTHGSLSTPVGAGDSNNVDAEIIAALQKWAAAWSTQDINAYISSYVSDYIPDGGVDHISWRKLRRQRLLSPSFIEVSVFDTMVDVLSPQRAMITFTQQYRSPAFHDRVRKLLLMQRGNDGWVISREHAIQ
jgi:tetratricopeptide (TPR) repeat protein